MVTSGAAPNLKYSVLPLSIALLPAFNVISSTFVHSIFLQSHPTIPLRCHGNIGRFVFRKFISTYYLHVPGNEVRLGGSCGVPVVVCCGEAAEVVVNLGVSSLLGAGPESIGGRWLLVEKNKILC